jgi:phosphoenolpyruvate carboxylase
MFVCSKPPSKDETELKTLQDMYDNWPWFRETIDLVGMILSKTDFSISRMYDEGEIFDFSYYMLGSFTSHHLIS